MHEAITDTADLRDSFRQILLENGASTGIEPCPVIDFVGNVPAGKRRARSGRVQIVEKTGEILKSSAKIRFKDLRRLLDLFPIARIQVQPEPDTNPPLRCKV